MDYPDHLIPKPDYRIIKDITAIRAHCLQRSTGDTAILNPETGKIKVEYIAFQRDHLRDLSTNLIGVFKKEDRYWRVIGDNKAQYIELWQEGESVYPPAEGDWEYNDQFGAIYFPIDELSNMTVPYTKGNDKEPKTVQCKVLHTPVRSNFWHCSIRWFNEDGDMIDQKGKWSKRMLSTARSMLVELGRLEPDFEEEVAVHLYKPV
jgi:hypothetical protein